MPPAQWPSPLITLLFLGHGRTPVYRSTHRRHVPSPHVGLDLLSSCSNHPTGGDRREIPANFDSKTLSTAVGSS